MEFQVARWFSRRESGFKVALIPDAPSAESNEFVPGILGCTAPNRQFAASLAFPVKDSEIANAAINSLESRRKRGFQTGAGHLGEADASQPLKPADRKCGITIAYLATKTRRAARKAGDLLMLAICCRAVGNQGWQCNCHPNEAVSVGPFVIVPRANGIRSYERLLSSASQDSLDGVDQPVDFILRVVQGE